MQDINISIYFDPNLIFAIVHQPNNIYLSKKFQYDDAVIEEIYQWLEQFTPNRTHICLLKHDTADILADELVDNGYCVHHVSTHQLLEWFTATPPATPDGSPVRALLRYLEEENPEQYVSRTPQIETLLNLFDNLDALEAVEDCDDEDSLPKDVLRLVKQRKISALTGAQSLIPALSERIREHLMRYPELMTPELMEDFFPELLEAIDRPKH
ncbi:hypothetical protein FD729_01300 [Pantoea sp. Nvir]|uniref:hypothetical protein n=1 Tax=Pantoea sp. Nvir TaxID=2576760 RepID=UPI001359680B|nr:hypothetical protein [Pantoea sp. Nvir]MXP66413.1 hypothetical protein [Pantoea sp. Nvir]